MKLPDSVVIADDIRVNGNARRHRFLAMDTLLAHQNYTALWR